VKKNKMSKFVRESIIVQPKRLTEKRKSVINSFRPLQRDIFKRQLLTVHKEMEEVMDAAERNTFFMSAVETSKNFILGEGVEFHSEDEQSKLMVETYWKSLGGELALSDAVSKTILCGNGYNEKDFYDVKKTNGILVPSKIYSLPDPSQIYINSDEYGNPLRKKIVSVDLLGNRIEKEIDNDEEYFIQKINPTMRYSQAKYYDIGFYGNAGVGSADRTRVYGIPIDKKKITHYKLMYGRTSLYGRSPLASALNDEEMLFQIERSIATIARYKAVPRKIWQYGNEHMPATGDELDEFMMYVESLDMEDDIMINKPIATTDLSYAGKEMKLDYAINHIKKKMIAGVSLDFLSGMGQDVNRACYSEDTRTLTENGWKYYWEWKPNEKIATFNPITEQIEFMKPTDLLVYDYKGKMINFKSQNVDVCVSPEHKMWYKPYKGNWQKKEAKELKKLSGFVFKRAAIMVGEEQKSFILPSIETFATCHKERFKEKKIDMNLWIKFLAWYISEGGFSSANYERKVGHITFAQSNKTNPSKVKDINKIMNELKKQQIITFGRYVSKKDACARWNVYSLQVAKWLKDNVGTYCHNKRIPSFIFELSIKQRQTFLDELIKGDGSVDKRYKNSKNKIYYSISKDLCEDVMRLAITLGLGASVLGKYGKRDVYRTSITDNNEAHVYCGKSNYRKNNLFEIDYKGKIYCFDAPPHRLFVTERNGKVSIQGNTAQQELLAFILSIYAKRKMFLKILQEEYIDPFIKWKRIKPVTIEFSSLDFETKNEKETRIRSNWQSNMLKFNEMRKEMGLPKIEEDRDKEKVGEMLFSELQTLNTPDFGGGFSDFGGFGGEQQSFGEPTPVTNEEPDAGTLNDTLNSSRTTPEIFKEDINYNRSGTLMLQHKLALGIKKVYEQRLANILDSLQRNKKVIEKKIVSEASIGINALENIMNVLKNTDAEIYPLLTHALSNVWTKAMNDMSQNIGRPLVGGDIRIAQALTKNAFGFLKKHDESMKAQLRMILTDGISQGDNINDISKEIKESFKTSNAKSECIARTEVIRTYNQSAIQTLKSNGIRKYKWLTSNDNKVCEICRPRNNVVYDVGRGPIPVQESHPNCFITPNIPILTDKGYKGIGKIEIGDLVLTQEGKYRKVVKTLTGQSYKGDVINIKIISPNGKKLHRKITLTPEHPILTKDGWKKANELTTKDEIKVIANKCKCGKLFFNFTGKQQYCCLKCANHYTAIEQFKDKFQHDIRSIKASEQMKREYKNGTRNKFEITKKANERVKELCQQKKFVLQKPEIRAKNWVYKTKEENKEIRKKISDYAINGGAAKACAANKSPSKPQVNLFNKIKKQYKNAILNYPIKIKKNKHFVLDIVLPENKINIEYDGSYWHKNKQKDLERDLLLKEKGWTVIRFNEDNINLWDKNLKAVMMNHNNEYNFMFTKISEIKKWTLKIKRKLYNFAVDEFENYIANGFCVHNCRCTIVGIPNTESFKSKENFNKIINYNTLVNSYQNVFNNPKETPIFYAIEEQPIKTYKISFMHNNVMINCFVTLKDLMKEREITEWNPEIEQSLWNNFENVFLKYAVLEV
jgi:SPP1 gp7 family putative phage head morphogenesis protein